MRYSHEGWPLAAADFLAGRITQSAEERLSAVLRAVGSLLAALATDLPAPAVGTAAAMTQPPGRGSDDLDRAQLVLEDARERARRIIDQSVVEAQDLLTRRGANDDAGVRRALSTLTDEMRDLRQRLDRIESLLRRQDQYPPRPTPVAPPMAPAPAPRPAQYAAPAYAPAAPPPQPPPPPAPPEPAGTRLLPDGGAVIVLVSPVAGFQGLMRVQEALVRLEAIAEAIVEGYAQGEARLRLTLRAPVATGTLGRELGAALGQPVDVQPVDGDDRALRVSLG